MLRFSFLFLGMLALCACTTTPWQQSQNNYDDFACTGDRSAPGCAPVINVLSGFGRISAASQSSH